MLEAQAELDGSDGVFSTTLVFVDDGGTNIVIASAAGEGYVGSVALAIVFQRDVEGNGVPAAIKDGIILFFPTVGKDAAIALIPEQ